jgi:hypothetical protein
MLLDLRRRQPAGQSYDGVRGGAEPELQDAAEGAEHEEQGSAVTDLSRPKKPRVTMRGEHPPTSATGCHLDGPGVPTTVAAMDSRPAICLKPKAYICSEVLVGLLRPEHLLGRHSGDGPLHHAGGRSLMPSALAAASTANPRCRSTVQRS